MTEKKIYDFEVENVVKLNDKSKIKITQVPPDIKYYGSMDTYYVNNDDYLILEQKGIVPGFKFSSEIKDFDMALENLLFARDNVDIESEIIKALIDCRNGIDARGIDYQEIIDWFKGENRIYRDDNDRWNLIIDKWCDHINSILAADGINDIRISQLDPRDDRINCRVSGQAGYFKLQHPKGHFYCCVSGAKMVYSILGSL